MLEKSDSEKIGCKNMEKHAYVMCSGDLFWVKLSPNMFFEIIATGKLLSKNEPQRF